VKEERRERRCKSGSSSSSSSSRRRRRGRSSSSSRERERDRVPVLSPLPPRSPSRFGTLAKTLLRFKSVPFGKVPARLLSTGPPPSRRRARGSALQKYFNDCRRRDIFLEGYNDFLLDPDAPFLSRGIRPANTVAEIASRIDTGLCASNSSRREGYSAER